MERNKQGMLFFILSEAIFFMLLVAAYIFYHKAGQGQSVAHTLDVFKTGVFSVFLFSSSGTMWLADIHAKRQNNRMVAFWLAGTIVLGAIFLIGQGLEYWNLLQHDITISRDLFGTTFFTLTGFHGFHVFVGLVMLAILFGLAFARSGREPLSKSAQVIGLYWHFVDVVWIVIFAVVYLWGVFV